MIQITILMLMEGVRGVCAWGEYCLRLRQPSNHSPVLLIKYCLLYVISSLSLTKISMCALFIYSLGGLVVCRERERSSGR